MVARRFCEERSDRAIPCGRTHCGLGPAASETCACAGMKPASRPLSLMLAGLFGPRRAERRGRLDHFAPGHRLLVGIERRSNRARPPFPQSGSSWLPTKLPSSRGPPGRRTPVSSTAGCGRKHLPDEGREGNDSGPPCAHVPRLRQSYAPQGPTPFRLAISYLDPVNFCRSTSAAPQ
jgi:hypothetical protein